MKRGRQQSSRRNLKTQKSEPKLVMETNADAKDGRGTRAPQQTLHKYLADITKERRKLMKNDPVVFKVELNTNFRQEFANFMVYVKEKLQVSRDYKKTKKNFSNAQARIEELETFNMEAKEALLAVLREQKKLQEKVTDLQGSSRRNNVRTFGVLEGTLY